MRRYSLDDTPWQPVTHDPGLKKRVLVPQGAGCVRRISHIVLRPGESASAHLHAKEYEIFYCVRGAIEFTVESRPVSMEGGGCLIIEPGETHSITTVGKETELLYLHVSEG